MLAEIHLNLYIGYIFKCLKSLLFSEGLSSSQKKRKARGKLLSAQKSLKKRLEPSYGIEILDKETSSEKPESQSEKHLNKLMNELKSHL